MTGKCFSICNFTKRYILISVGLHFLGYRSGTSFYSSPSHRFEKVLKDTLKKTLLPSQIGVLWSMVLLMGTNIIIRSIATSHALPEYYLLLSVMYKCQLPFHFILKLYEFVKASASLTLTTIKHSLNSRLDGS